jgi:hypothetical protein
MIEEPKLSCLKIWDRICKMIKIGRSKLQLNLINISTVNVKNIFASWCCDKSCYLLPHMYGFDSSHYIFFNKKIYTNFKQKIATIWINHRTIHSQKKLLSLLHYIHMTIFEETCKYIDKIKHP